MTTLCLRISDEHKRLIKMQAAYEGKTMTDYVLERTLPQKKGTIHQALKDLEEENVTRYENVEELFADMDTW